MKLYFCITCLSFFTHYLSIAQGKADTSSSSSIANQNYIAWYKENGEFSYTSPKGEIGAPSKYILMGKLTNTYMLLGTQNSRIAFAVIPDFTVRVRDEGSAGVRTPSFKLGGVLYGRIGSDYKKYQYAELGFTHHSNGQDENAINDDGSLNTRTGNFSTNYLTASYRFGEEYLNRAEMSNSLNHRIGLEWHKWFAYEKALENDYGFTRLLYNFSWRTYTRYISTKANRSWRKNRKGITDNTNSKVSMLEKESLRFNFDFSYALNKMATHEFLAIKKRLNMEASLHGSLPFMNRAMLMISGGYYGEDPYNIYYRDSYPYIRVGISTGFMRYKLER